MRSSRRVTWIIYALCALLVVDGLGWVTWRLVRLEGEQRAAQREAATQETLRLALWRMDSAIAPLLAAEAGRPYFHYRALIPEERAYAGMWPEVGPEEAAAPSPLLTGAGRFIRLHFERLTDGTLRSPQAPSGAMRARVIERYAPTEAVRRAEADLEALRTLLEDAALEPPAPDAATPPERRAEDGQPPGRSSREGEARAGGAPGDEPDPGGAGQRAEGDFRARQSLAETARQTPPEQAAYLNRTGPPAPSALRSAGEGNGDGDGDEAGMGAAGASSEDQVAQDANASRERPAIAQGPFEAVWRRDPSSGGRELIFVREVRIGSRRVVQGFWVDWPALRRDLLGRVVDLLPGADLEPVPPRTVEPADGGGSSDGRSDERVSGDGGGSGNGSARAAGGGRRLATIPARLAPSGVPLPPEQTVTSTRATLVVTWLAVLAAIGAIGVVLHASMRLSARRGRFVSAVTHELRTPLTTFSMYTQMLADGMVQGEARQRAYLATLRDEAARLTGIVENVLSYARLGGRVPEAAGTEPLGEMLDAITPGLERRAAQGGLRLVTEIDERARRRQVPGERDAIERILTNLVDNACKYAAGAADDRLHLRVTPERKRVRIEVADHGPGVSAGERRRIFDAFHRAESASGAGAPGGGSGSGGDGARDGLGLGLALSRGLARRLGGDLELARPSGPGAVFRLTLASRASDPG